MADTVDNPLAGAAPRAETPKLRWDDSKMATHYANVANAFGTREEIVLLFGVNQTWQSGQDELIINLSNRIIMNPFAARRLLTVLERAVSDYETRTGTTAGVTPASSG